MKKPERLTGYGLMDPAENMSKETGDVAISIGEDMLLGDSSQPEQAERVEMPSGEGVLVGDSSQSQLQEISVNHGSADNVSEESNRAAVWSGDDMVLGDPSRYQLQEITAYNHRPPLPSDRLLKVVQGANGMVVLFVPCSDGRLGAVAMDSLQNLVHGNPKNNRPGFPKKKKKRSGKSKHKDFRAWLLLLASLVASVSFTAGLTTPGGFWAADDMANGYVAGTSVMRDKFPMTYLAFYYSNSTAFLASLAIIGMLAKDINSKQSVVMKKSVFKALVALCFVSLVASYIAGTGAGQPSKRGNSRHGGIYNFVIGVVVVYMICVVSWMASIRSRERPTESLV